MSQFVNHFAGTASYYARFRPGYPSALYDLLSHQAGLNHSTSVLDLGCGPGIIAIGLAGRTKWVTGVDPDTEMLKEATVAASVGAIHNASWVLSTAEDFADEPRSYRLITIASAFHWMDRQRVAEKAHNLLESGGLLALIGNPTPLSTCFITHRLVEFVRWVPFCHSAERSFENSRVTSANALARYSRSPR